MPESQPGVAAYLACQTQWRTGFAGRTGLDYNACIATLGMHLPRWQHAEADARAPAVFAALDVAELMESVQIIEHALLEADGEQRERDAREKPAAPR